MTAGQIIARGLTNRCPNCGGRTLFAGLFRAADRCARCGLKFEREDGFFLGALVFNYTFTTVLLLAPMSVIVYKQAISVPAAIAIAVVWCILFPALFYRPSKSLWLMTYYLCFPRHLPANGGDPTGADDSGLTTSGTTRT